MNFEPNQNPSEVRNAIVYKIDRFSENMILFGVSVGFFLFLDFIINNLLFSTSILVTGILFHIVERKISEPINDIINTSIYFESKPKLFFVWGILALFLFFIFLVAYKIFSIPGEPFLDYYTKSLFLSSSVFMLSGFLSVFLILTSLVDSNLIRRGFFAIFQRWFILSRCVVVTPLWREFMVEEKFRMLSIYIYIGIKVALLLMVLQDTINKWHIFIVNKKKLFTPAPEECLNNDSSCPFCFCYPIEPIILPCHHISCYACMNQWAKAKSRNLFCPLCREPVECPTQIELSDGCLPSIMLFVTF
ncbi:negative regulation of interleukin-2 secretion [Tritrichomonas musculus]|uniref:Negative regulation of interleukin-2 secretion n=1 Tax=Tritrichomonas musculus TaxID=1915356 RepID=A0ABR2J025_9EUKA